jgi:hypothetical protein
MVDLHNPNVVGNLTGVDFASIETPAVERALPYWNNTTSSLDTSASRFKVNGNAAELYFGAAKVAETTANGLTGAVWG